VIFLTVGTQLPFDRLSRAMDEWAFKNPSVEIFGQIGPGIYKPTHFPSKDFVSPVEFDELISRSELIVAHAGMGSILTALQFCKPIVIFPRRASLFEHRNDHQFATAKKFHGKPGVAVAFEIPDLYQLLSDYRSLRGGPCISQYADPGLISKVKHWIDNL
jgi:UDP-N-acetylglucosamine transferase subunit ALG13